MFPIFETPIFIALIIVFYLLFFFILFITKLPGENGKQQRKSKMSEEMTQVAEESRSECTMFGFLEKLPKGDPIPDECMSCPKLVECLMKKKEFDWYTGQNSAQDSRNGRTNGTEMPKHTQEWREEGS